MSDLRTVLAFGSRPDRFWLLPLCLLLLVYRWTRKRRKLGHKVAPFVYSTH